MSSLGQFLPKPGDKHKMASSKHREHGKFYTQATWKNSKEHNWLERHHP